MNLIISKNFKKVWDDLSDDRDGSRRKDCEFRNNGVYSELLKDNEDAMYKIKFDLYHGVTRS